MLSFFFLEEFFLTIPTMCDHCVHYYAPTATVAMLKLYAQQNLQLQH